MYKKLKQLIENHNEQYQKLNDIVHSLEKDPNKDKTELELWQHNSDGNSFMTTQISCTVFCGITCRS